LRVILIVRIRMSACAVEKLCTASDVNRFQNRRNRRRRIPSRGNFHAEARTEVNFLVQHWDTPPSRPFLGTRLSSLRLRARQEVRFKGWETVGGKRSRAELESLPPFLGCRVESGNRRQSPHVASPSSLGAFAPQARLSLSLMNVPRSAFTTLLRWEDSQSFASSACQSSRHRRYGFACRD